MRLVVFIVLVSLIGCGDTFSDGGALGGATLDEKTTAIQEGFSQGIAVADKITQEAIEYGYAEKRDDPHHPRGYRVFWKNGKELAADETVFD